MKTINNFINEKLKISSKSKSYSCWPKDKFELRKILEERLAEDKDANLNDIDVSQITDMGYKGFPDNTSLFEGLDPHNIDISKWDVSNVTNMYDMFFMCHKFEGYGLENWDVSNVIDMNSMFYACENFNCDLSNWNVSKVRDMSSMFAGCEKFTGKGLENWDVSNCENMYNMFLECAKLNCDLSNWDVSKVKNMTYMFADCQSLKNKPSWYIEYETT